jgi:hypothetical protein
LYTLSTFFRFNLIAFVVGTWFPNNFQKSSTIGTNDITYVTHICSIPAKICNPLPPKCMLFLFMPMRPCLPQCHSFRLSFSACATIKSYSSMSFKLDTARSQKDNWASNKMIK